MLQRPSEFGGEGRGKGGGLWSKTPPRTAVLDSQRDVTVKAPPEARPPPQDGLQTFGVLIVTLALDELGFALGRRRRGPRPMKPGGSRQLHGVRNGGEVLGIVEATDQRGKGAEELGLRKHYRGHGPEAETEAPGGREVGP